MTVGPLFYLFVYLAIGAVIGMIEDVREMKKPVPYARVPATLPLSVIRKVALVFHMIVGIPFVLLGLVFMLVLYLMDSFFPSKIDLVTKAVLVDTRSLPSDTADAMKILTQRFLEEMRKYPKDFPPDMVQRVETALRQLHPEWF